MPAERGIRRPPARAQGLYPRHQEHRARRRDQLRLRHGLFQSLSEADRLQMRILREEAQEDPSRGEGGKGAAEGKGRAQSAEEGRETRQSEREGERKSQKAQWQGQRRATERAR